MKDFNDTDCKISNFKLVMSTPEKYMRRCLELAEQGLGHTKSNPLVGAMLVYANNIIGEGYHQKFGEAHAEVNCIRNVKESQTHLIKDSTLYVNLEPCNHTGKTPPCVDLILKEQIKKVCIASMDPNPLVAGQGIAKLRAEGVHVQCDILRDEAIELNKRFFTFHEKKRPYIILKYALSRNGFFCRSDKQQQWLSTAETKKLVHQWRSEEMAILVGKNTVINDNPALTVRLVNGDNPTRIILDRHLELEHRYQVFQPNAEVLVMNQMKNGRSNNVEYCKIFSLEDILDVLFQKNIHSLIIEGGLEIIQEFIAANLFDEIREIQTETLIEEGMSLPKIMLKPMHSYSISSDQIFIYRNQSKL